MSIGPKVFVARRISHFNDISLLYENSFIYEVPRRLILAARNG